MRLPRIVHEAEVPRSVRGAVDLALRQGCPRLGIATPPVVYFADEWTRMGFADGGRVFIRADLAPVDAWETALHELKHLEQHARGLKPGAPGRRDAESEAEGFALTISRAVYPGIAAGFRAIGKGAYDSA